MLPAILGLLLGFSGTPAAGAIAAQGDSAPEVAAQAITWLAGHGHEADGSIQPEVVGRLISSCADQRASWCEALLATVARLPTLAERNQTQLLRLAGADDLCLKAFAALAAAPQLTAATKQGLFERLATINDAYVPDLIRALLRIESSGRWDLSELRALLRRGGQARLRAYSLIAELGKPARPLAGEVAEGVGDPAPEVRSAAARALVALGIGDLQLLTSAQRRAADRKDTPVADRIECATRGIPGAVPDPQAALIACLKSRDTETVESALTSVTPQAVPNAAMVVSAYLRVAPPATFSTAVSALVRLGWGTAPELHQILQQTTGSCEELIPLLAARAGLLAAHADWLWSAAKRCPAILSSADASLPLRRIVEDRLLHQLGSQDPAARDAALDALQALPIDGPALASLKTVATHVELCCEALSELARRGVRPDSSDSLFSAALRSPDDSTRTEALRAMTRLHLVASQEDRVRELLEDNAYLPAQEAAINALASDQALFARHVDRIAVALENDQLATAAMEALGRYPLLARPYAARVIRWLTAGEFSTAPRAARELISRVSPDPALTIQLLAAGSANAQAAADFRFAAYLASGGGELIGAIRLLGNPPTPDRPAPEALRDTLRVLTEVASSKATDEVLARELVGRIDELIGADSTPRHWLPGWLGRTSLSWHLDDRPLLEGLNRALAGRGVSSVPLGGALRFLELLALARGAVALVVTHLLLWLLLLLAYPVSPKVQAFFFWNSAARRFLGLGYVELLLLHAAPLRRRLLAPFRSVLIEEATGEDLFEGGAGASSYFDGARVRELSSVDGRALPILEALAEIRGHVVLLGESGLGKTMFIRHLIARTRRVVAYLPAERCAQGVIPALQSKMQGKARDEAFLRSIVHAGAIDLCIDGLNEVAPETRAEIRQFIVTNPGCNVLVATQKLLDWQVPARSLEILPLEEAQIASFLRSRPPGSPTTPAASQRYAEQCDHFVERSLSRELAPEVAGALRTVLSNPMDLTVVARMLWEGHEPDLLQLQRQLFGIVARHYRDACGAEFPLERLADTVYELRLKDESDLPIADFPEEIAALARQKLVIRRVVQGGVTRWLFRHDKIRDYVLLQKFIREGSSLAMKHLHEPRFRGVYFMLAMQLPIEAATRLREELVIQAAQTKDHVLSDRFVELLESRRRAASGRPGWASGLSVPGEAELAARVEASAEELDTLKNQLTRLQDLPRLLYPASDYELASLVVEALVELGGSPEEETPAGCKAVRTPGGRRCFVAVVSSAGEVSEGQVGDALRLLPEDGASRSERLLVVSNGNGLEPAKRATPGEPIRRRARERRAALMTVVELFDLVVRARSSRGGEAAFWASLAAEAQAQEERQ